MKYLFLAAGVVSIYFAGCVEPETLYRAEPMSDNTVWFSGKEFQTKTKDGITVSVAFENEVEGTLTFYMVVGNLGSKTVLVAPEKICYKGSYQKVRHVYDPVTADVTYDTTNVVDSVYVVNPENQLVGIDKQIARADASYATNNGMNAATGLLQLVGDISTIGKPKSKEQIHKEDEQRRSLEASEASNEINHNAQTSALGNEGNYWANATLRKTSLFPSTAIGGKICFPVDANLQTLKLVVPVDSTTIEFNFKQEPIPNQ